MLFVLDTSNETIGICIFDGTQVIVEQIWRSQHHHTTQLMPAIERVFKQSSLLPKDLTGLGVALGPGSFTSLRIGVSTIKGMALGLNLPVVGIPSLDILAASQPKMDLPVIAILQLGRGRMASMRYQYLEGGWTSVSDLMVSDARELAQSIEGPVYICGEMSPQERQILGRKWKNTKMAPASLCVRRPVVLAELAWWKLQNNQVDDVVSLSPIYVHTLSNIPDL